ncbi:hypothetical protein [Bacillus solitudinis]
MGQLYIGDERFTINIDQ